MFYKGVRDIDKSRRFYSLFAAALAGVWLAGCAAAPSGVPPASSAAVTADADIHTRGIVAVAQGNWIYYSASGLYRVKTDGSGKQKLCGGSVSGICIDGEWIYYDVYNVDNNNESFAAIKTDGTDNHKLFDIDTVFPYFTSGLVSYGFFVVDDRIYCGVSDKMASDIPGLYSMKSDGSDQKKLCGDQVGGAVVSGDWIYYDTVNMTSGIYAIKADGSARTAICADQADGFGLAGDQIVYINSGDNGALYSIKTDGTGKQRLGGDSASQLVVSGGRIYYELAVRGVSGGGKVGPLYSMKLDGSGRRKLCDDQLYYFDVVGDWIYYSNSVDFNIYRIKTDGSHKQLVN